MTPVAETLVRHYEACFDKHGDCAKGFDWPDERGAQVRHRVMSELFQKEKSVSILDIGCGSGQFLSYLKDFNVNVEYYGVDLSQKFIEVAKKKFPSAWFQNLDLTDPEDADEVPEVDYAICNGIFTLKGETSTEEMELFREKLLAAIWKKCRRGMAYNIMAQDLVQWKRDDLFYANFSDEARRIEKNHSKNFVFRRDYGMYEFTAYVYREGEGQ